MQDNVRTMSIAAEDSDPIEQNVELQQRLVEFFDSNIGHIFVGSVNFTGGSLIVQFEALGDADPDEILEGVHGASAATGSDAHDPAHGPDGSTPDPTPTGESTASTGERDASDGDTTDADPAPDTTDDDPTTPDDGDDDTPPWEQSSAPEDDAPDESGARPWRLVDEDGNTLSTFGTEKAAWDAFENYNDAFDVVNREEQ